MTRSSSARFFLRESGGLVVSMAIFAPTRITVISESVNEIKAWLTEQPSPDHRPPAALPFHFPVQRGQPTRHGIFYGNGARVQKDLA